MPAPIISRGPRSCPASGNVQFRYRSDKLISPAGHGLDERIAILIVPQNFPQDEDVLAEIALFDKTLRPKGLHQFFFFQYPTAVLHQEKQDLKALGSEGYRLAMAREDTLLRVKLEPRELVQHLGFFFHLGRFRDFRAAPR